MASRRRLASVLIAAIIASATCLRAQQPEPADSIDIHYYDAWPGAWHKVEGSVVDSLPTFVITRGPGNSFLENWFLVIDGKRTESFGLRSWDVDTKSWRLVWVADPNHFQIWDGTRQPDGWYITRRFGEGANAFLSRQAWIPQGPDQMLRTLERSVDDGRTWTVRSKNVFQKMK